MRLKYKLIFIFLGLNIACFAQADTNNSKELRRMERKMKNDSLQKLPKIFLSINAGWSLPFGNYGTSDNYGSQSYTNLGFAGQGNDYAILAGIALNKQNWEPQLMLASLWNSFDVNSFAEASQPAGWTGWIDAGSARYSFYEAMPGIARTFKNSNIEFDIRLMIGLISGQISSMQYTVQQLGSQDIDYVTMSSAKYSSYAYDLGIGLKIYFTPHIMGMANADFFSSGTNLTFNIPTQTTSSSGVIESVQSFSPAQVSQINVSFGIGYAIAYSKSK
ncbi:MAG: hypothetical protein ACLQQ4_19365 [Bacteroidia bacterium]